MKTLLIKVTLPVVRATTFVLNSDINKLAGACGVSKLHDETIEDVERNVTWGDANRTLIDFPTYTTSFKEAVENAVKGAREIASTPYDQRNDVGHQHALYWSNVIDGQAAQAKKNAKAFLSAIKGLRQEAQYIDMEN
jgi:hypothetical protein